MGYKNKGGGGNPASLIGRNSGVQTKTMNICNKKDETVTVLPYIYIRFCLKILLHF